MAYMETDNQGVTEARYGWVLVQATLRGEMQSEIISFN